MALWAVAQVRRCLRTGGEPRRPALADGRTPRRLATPRLGQGMHAAAPLATGRAIPCMGSRCAWTPLGVAGRDGTPRR
jgi:hypothetical protein